MLRQFLFTILFSSSIFLSYPAWAFFTCPDQQTDPLAFSYYFLPPDKTHLSGTVFVKINYDSTHYLLGSMECFDAANCHLAPPLLLRKTIQPVMLNYLPSCVYVFNTTRFHDPSNHPNYPGDLVLQLNYDYKQGLTS